MYSMERTKPSHHNKHIPYSERPVTPEVRKARRENGRKVMTELALKGMAVAGVGVALVAGYNKLTQEDESRFENNKIAVEEIHIADDATIRENPTIKTYNTDGYSNELTTTDFGDLANSGEHITLTPEHDVYRVDTVNGDFYGINVEDLETVLPDKADALSKDKDGIAWINQQRASVEYADNDK